MERRWKSKVAPAIVIVAAGVVLVRSAASGDGPRMPLPGDSGTQGTPATSPSSVPLTVQLDAVGRPYDTAMPDGASISRERLTTLHAPSGQIHVMGGEEAIFTFTGAPIRLATRKGNDYPIDVIWVKYGSARTRAAAGVMIVERPEPVVRWAAFPPANYGTDAGTGAITTPEWSRSRQAAEFDEATNPVWKALEGPVPADDADQMTILDVDGVPGTDTIVFANGYGDGGFPGVAGYAADGRRSKILIWSVIVPWRLAVPEGTPPVEVVDRERELAQCLAGKRTIQGWSGCRAARRTGE